MRKSVPGFAMLLAAAAVSYWIVTGGAIGLSAALAGSPEAANPNLSTQTSSARGVTINVTPKNLASDADSWEFAVVLDTHSQDLSDDLVKSSLLLDGAGGCALNGNVVTTGDDFDAYRYSLERTVRKELERSWRVFTRDPAAAFDIVTDRSEALRVLSTMEVQQGARMQHLGLNFILNDDICAAFYRNLVGDGIGSGYAVLSALTVGEEVVATLLGIRNGSRYVMVRISNAGDKWSNCSPGRLIIERTMAALHRDGVREFDFSIGNYAYKRRFGVTPLALVDITASLSWRGLPYALRDRAARELRNYPRLAALVKRALGREPSREEN